MTNLSFQELCNSIADEVERCLPEILRNPDDFNIAQGNCVLCMMNAEGETSMRMYGGTNRPRQREAAMVAHKKALQVWLTGQATGYFETLVYAGKLDDEQFGISRPEFIGWLGGVEAKQADGSRLVLAFSGVRGEQDVGVLRMAAQNLKTFSIVE